MRFVVPISQIDVHLLSKRVEVFKRLGGWKNHHLLFAPAPSCFGEALKAADDLKEVCPNVEVRQVLREPTGGWPEACNKHFYDTAVVLERMGNPLNWFFLELDCNPLRAGWQDAAETAYNAGGKPFCGHVRATAEVTSPPMKGSHMVGAGMYPANFTQIAAAEYRAIPKNEPFDISLRWRVLQSGVVHTDLIAHRHSSRGYTLEGSQLVAQGQDPVSIETTAILHGCKDDSVADLVLSGALDGFGPVIKSAPEEVKPAKSVTTEVHKPTLEAQLLAGGYRTPIKGVWVHMSVSNEDVANHFGVKTEIQAAKPPMTAMDFAIAAAHARLVSQPISSEVQHGAQGDPETGSSESPHETLDVAAEENPPEQGVDNAAPPVHTETEDSGSQGETNETSSDIAPGDGDPQTGQSLLNDLTLRAVRLGKPKRIADWAEEFKIDKEELKHLINSHPDSGLSIARAGWVQLAVA